MHIAIVANGFQEDYIVDLLNSIAGKAEKIDFIGSSFYPREKIDTRINILDFRGEHTEDVALWYKINRMLLYYSKLLRYIVGRNATVIHVQWLRFNFLEGVFFTLLARSLGIKVVYTAHDVLPHMKDNIYNRIVFYIIYHLQNQIIVHTEFIYNRLMKEFKVPDSKLSLVKHGVYQVKENKAVNKTLAKSSFGLKELDKVILFFGIITKYKGLDILLKAFQEFRKYKSDYYLVIAGHVAIEYKSNFEKIIVQYNNSNIIKQLQYIEDDEMEYLFKAADVIVLPYLEASQSGVLFMSYAYGRPVIAPKLGGFPHDIINQKTGLLFTPGDPDSLLETLKEFDILFPDFFAESEAFIKQYVNENYSWESSGKELIKTYTSIIS
ncbi:MAG: glycosyltransferase [Bacteroidales bacterium]